MNVGLSQTVQVASWFLLSETNPLRLTLHQDQSLFPKEKTYLWRTSLYLAASASAEFFADIALCPMEAVKVRIQTQPGWANNLREGLPKLMAEEGVWGYVHKRNFGFTSMQWMYA